MRQHRLCATNPHTISDTSMMHSISHCERYRFASFVRKGHTGAAELHTLGPFASCRRAIENVSNWVARSVFCETRARGKGSSFAQFLGAPELTCAVTVVQCIQRYWTLKQSSQLAIENPFLLAEELWILCGRQTKSH